jgi:trehalose-phosphatase
MSRTYPFLAPPNPAEHRDWRSRLSRARRVLVGTDFDGTLAPIVPRPEAAAPLPEAVTALGELARRRDLRVAVISGRALSDLRARCPVPGAWYLGGHGNEISPELPAADAGGSEQARGHAAMWRALANASERLRARLPDWPGVRLEAKPFSLAIHFRQAPQWAEPIHEAVSALADEGGLRVLFGRRIAELLPADALNKGQALLRLRRRLGCDLAFYFGDDTTDEDVFRIDREHTVGIKVLHAEGADGTTAAEFSVASPREVAAAFSAIAAVRPGIQKKYLPFYAVPT